MKYLNGMLPADGVDFHGSAETWKEATNYILTQPETIEEEDERAKRKIWIWWMRGWDDSGSGIASRVIL